MTPRPTQLTIRAFAALALMAPAIAQAQEFTPLASAGMSYPLPPVVLPPAPSSGDQAAATSSSYIETEASPALQLSRAWLRIAGAQQMERSPVTQRLYDQWQAARREHGPTSQQAIASEAAFVAQYHADLAGAAKVYGEVEQLLGGIDPAAEGEADAQLERLTNQAVGLAKTIDKSASYHDAACIIDPASCMPPDQEDQQIMGDIEALAAQLGSDDQGGELSADALKRKVHLLKTRNHLTYLVVQRKAARLALAVASPGDSAGRPFQLANASAARRAERYVPGDPYR